MNKEQIEDELRLAYVKKLEKENLLNYVDKDFVDVLAYELKAIDCKISALRKMYDNAEDEKPTKKEMSKFWSGYILSCMQVPVGIKKDTAVGKHDSI